jgi:Contractile injection system tape measure protein
MPLPMTPPNRHRVQRQVVELAIGDSAEGPAVHRELARPFWDRAAPELERVFDSVAAPHELLRLERLELDLGQIDGADWPVEFRRKLIAELTRSLAQFTAASKARDSDAPPEPGRTEPWREFLFFLSHGYLPWWGARPSNGWTDTLPDRLDAAGWSALREAVRADPRARARLIQSVGDEFLDTAVGRWAGVPHAARVLEHWTPTSLRADARQRWRRAFWISVIDWVCAGGFRSPRGGSELVRNLLALRRTYVPESEGRKPLQASPRDGNEQPHSIDTAQDDNLPSPWHEWVSQVGTVPLDRAVPETHTDTGTRSVGARAEAPSRPAAPDQVRRPAEDEAIYLEGAGAILLHPFLEQLFRERGLLAGRDFRDIEARHRAVHLIGLLTFGIVDIPEYELVLAKAICGARFEEPLEPVELENDDLVACDALLRAVLEHWAALRSSSPEWLRQQFFLREGKLERVDSGYLLTIERRAQDVLLARLPWGCGVVALPWLAERMFVRWLD